MLHALPGHVSEARWLRFARQHLRHLFPYLPGQPGYNKGEPGPAGAQFFKPLRQIIESVNDTFKGQLDLEPTAGTPQPGSWPGSCSESWP